MSKKILQLLAEGMAAGGHLWYEDARRAIQMQYGKRQMRRAAAVLAITSQRVHVRRNWRMAQAYMAGFPIRALPRVLTNLQRWEHDHIVRGPKIGPFAKALRGDDHAVVVDIWMLRAYGLDTPTPRNVRRVERSIRRTASQTGMLPAQVQAAVWHATITRHGKQVARYSEMVND